MSKIEQALDRLDRIRAAQLAGRALEADDAAALVAAIDRAVKEKTTLEAGLGLVGNWRQAVGCRKAMAAVKSASRPRSGGLAELRERLIRYRHRSFETDLSAGRAREPANATYFELLRATRGHVPSERTLRRYKADL